jgi:hypothetical protein
MPFFDDLELEIRCPGCGKPIRQKASWFREEHQVCPHGCEAILNTEEFRWKIDEANRQFDDTQRLIRSKLTYEP